MPQFVLRDRDGLTARNVLDDLVEVYREVYDVPPYTGDPFFDTDDFARRLRAALDMPGFQVVSAHTPEGAVAGYAYGVVLPPDRPWWVALDDACPRLQRRAAQRGEVFWLRELMVREPYRRAGLGRRLHHTLLDGRREVWSALTCLPDNEPAHAAYLRWAYRVLGRTTHGPDSPAYDAMVLRRGRPVLPGPRRPSEAVTARCVRPADPTGPMTLTR